MMQPDDAHRLYQGGGPGVDALTVLCLGEAQAIGDALAAGLRSIAEALASKSGAKSLRRDVQSAVALAARLESTAAELLESSTAAMQLAWATLEEGQLRDTPEALGTSLKRLLDNAGGVLDDVEKYVSLLRQHEAAFVLVGISLPDLPRLASARQRLAVLREQFDSWPWPDPAEIEAARREYEAGQSLSYEEMVRELGAVD
jgi:hypothetical protein